MEEQYQIRPARASLCSAGMPLRQPQPRQSIFVSPPLQKPFYEFQFPCFVFLGFLEVSVGLLVGCMSFNTGMKGRSEQYSRTGCCCAGTKSSGFDKTLNNGGELHYTGGQGPGQPLHTGGFGHTNLLALARFPSTLSALLPPFHVLVSPTFRVQLKSLCCQKTTGPPENSFYLSIVLF